MPSKLPPKQEVYISAILSGKSKKEASVLAGVDPRTARKWEATPEYRARYHELVAAVTTEAMSILASSIPKAVQTLFELLDPSCGEATRYQAASRILAEFPRYREIGYFESKLAEIQNQLKQRGVG